MQDPWREGRSPTISSMFGRDPPPHTSGSGQTGFDAISVDVPPIPNRIPVSQSPVTRLANGLNNMGLRSDHGVHSAQYTGPPSYHQQSSNSHNFTARPAPFHSQNSFIPQQPQAVPPFSQQTPFAPHQGQFVPPQQAPFVPVQPSFIPPQQTPFVPVQPSFVPQQPPVQPSFFPQQPAPQPTFVPQPQSFQQQPFFQPMHQQPQFQQAPYNQQSFRQETPNPHQPYRREPHRDMDGGIVDFRPPKIRDNLRFYGDSKCLKQFMLEIHEELDQIRFPNDHNDTQKINWIARHFTSLNSTPSSTGIWFMGLLERNALKV